MPVPVTTTVSELPESRVRIEAEVAPSEIDKRVNQAARQLSKNLRIPGFRAGKTPPAVVVKRMGREAVLDEAVRDSLPSWYAAAIEDARVAAIGEPQLDFSELPKPGEPLRFSIEVGVRPKAQLGQYKGLEVPKREAVVSEATIDEELEALRQKTATLETVERPARTGDYVVMDFAGSIDGQLFEGGEGRDQMIELGAGQLIPGFEEQLEGATAGEARVIKVTFPADYGAEQLAGKDAEFAVEIKEVKESRLPELDDEFATTAGFDTLDELKADVRERRSEADRGAIEREFREAAVDAAVAQATVDTPEALVEAHAQEIWNQTLHALSHQGINREMFLQISGRSEEEILAEGKEDARQALKREAVLVAIAEAEGLDPTDDELVEALGQAAAREQTTPEQLLEQLKASGRIEQAKQELVQRRALDVIVDAAKPVPAPPAGGEGDAAAGAGGAPEAAPAGSSADAS